MVNCPQLGEASPVVVKEGLVGSVIATNLWSVFSRDQPCEVQIHGLELVLVPRCRPGKKSDNGEDDNSRVSAGGTGNSSTTEGSEADVGGALGGGADAAYMDIEVGVRAIAQIVEKVLLGLCVKVSNLTITLEQPPQEVKIKQDDQRELGQLGWLCCSPKPCRLSRGLLFQSPHIFYDVRGG